MKKNLLFWIYFAFAIIFMIYFGIRIIMTCFWNSPVSEVKSVYFSGNLENGDIVFFQSVVGITSRDINTYSISLTDVNNRILSQPEVKSSATRRVGNGKLDIKIEKYEPVAFWTDGDFYYPITQNGIIISRPTSEMPAASFIFIGKTGNDLMPLIKSAAPLFEEIAYIEWIENRRWDIYTNDGLRILLPEKDFVSAVAKLAVLNKEHDILSRDIKSLDLRDNTRILIKE